MLKSEYKYREVLMIIWIMLLKRTRKHLPYNVEELHFISLYAATSESTNI